jgi:RHS repeat-associated protein
MFKASYDAWGYQTITNNTFKFHRGYTGHEHLPEFGLINMNGRMYDPIVGRFLSPDPYVQAPDFSQSYNRYSYCLNNPLIYTDPSGEFAWLAAAVYVYMAGVQANMMYCANNLANPFNPGQWNWSSPSTYISMATAALNTTGLMPNLNVPGFFTNGALQAGVNVAHNGISNVINDKDFFDNWEWSAFMGFINGAAIGYHYANEVGLNPWTGTGYQKALNNKVSQDGINNPNHSWMVASKRNAKLVNEQYGTDISVSGRKINYGTESTEFGTNVGSRFPSGRGVNNTNYTLITRKAIRNRTDIDITDIIRHESRHRIQNLYGFKGDRVSIEVDAYRYNFLNPATSTTKQSILQVLLKLGDTESMKIYNLLK